jgi:cobalt-zinc-cadmium efflux system protein
LSLYAHFCNTLSRLENEPYIGEIKISEHNHNSNHDHSQSAIGRLRIALIIVLIIFVVEIFGGILSNSLALQGDAGHMLVDAFAIALSMFAMQVAKKPATSQKTYGYHRAEILVALANGTVLIMITAYIFYEAYRRMWDPPDIQTPLMLIIATIGLIGNFIGLMLLKGPSHSSLNVKGAFWHIVGDLVSSVGVIVAALIIYSTGWKYADPIVSILIGFIILWGAVRIVLESAEILLESVPRHLKVTDVSAVIRNIEGVTGVHDVHVWTITSGIYALSAHIIVDDLKISQGTEIVKSINARLESQFNITHSTLQVECTSCPTGVVCSLG